MEIKLLLHGFLFNIFTITDFLNLLKLKIDFDLNVKKFRINYI